MADTIANKADLTRIVEERVRIDGASIISLGGDCFAVAMGGEVRLALSLKESTMKDVLWVGAPDPILNALIGKVRVPGASAPTPVSINRCFIVLVHVPRKTVMLIPIFLVYKDMIDRARADRKLVRFNFDVKVNGYRKYAIKGTDLLADKPLKYVATLDPLWELLQTPVKPGGE